MQGVLHLPGLTHDKYPKSRLVPERSDYRGSNRYGGTHRACIQADTDGSPGCYARIDENQGWYILCPAIAARDLCNDSRVRKKPVSVRQRTVNRRQKHIIAYDP